MTLPPEPIVTVPLAGCVTDVTVAPGFSKLSFAKTLNVAAVSSAVVTLFATMSATGVTVIATELATAGATPSDVDTFSVVLPFQSAVGANRNPLSAVVIAAGVPETVTVPLPLPVTVIPAIEPSVSVPLTTVSVVVTELSTSTTVMALPFAALNMRLVSSALDCAPGTVLTGASLTAATLTVTVAVSVTPPDVTV